MAMRRCCSCLGKFRETSLTPLRRVWGSDSPEEFCAPCRKNGMKYYVLAVEPGEDEKVRRRLTTKIKVEDMRDEIDLVLVPRHAEFRARRSDGKPVRRAKKSTPGYLIVRMHFSDDAYALIKSIPGAWDLLPMKPVLNRMSYPKKDKPKKLAARKHDLEAVETWSPTALESEEAALLLLRHAARKEKPKPAGGAEVGDRVQLQGGMFDGMEGPVVAVDGEGEDATFYVEVTVLGRAVRAECGYWQFTKLGD